MNKQIVKQIKELIDEYENIVIYRHRSPDYDAVGSQMGLKHLINNNYDNKNVYCFGDEDYYDFENVDMYDQVPNSIIKKSLIIVLDTANKDRVSNLNYKFGQKIIKIDHHQVYQGESYGEVNLELVDYSSTCEIIYYLAQEFGFKLDSKCAKSLFCGMYTDTGGFKFSNTNQKTFLALSDLITYDFDYEKVVNNLETYNYNLMKAVGYAYQNLKIIDGVGYIIYDFEIQKQLNVSAKELSLVVGFLGKIKELKTWIVFNYYNDFIRVNIRSKSKYDISKIASEHSGGGHKNASGAMVYSNEEINEVVNKLVELVND